MRYDFARTEGGYNFLKLRGYDFPMVNIGYCVSGNIRQVLIFPKFANSKLREKSQDQKFEKIETRKNYQIYSILLGELPVN